MVYFNKRYLLPAVLLFIVEVIIAMYAHGLQNSKLARIIMGDYFSWMDMLMYTLGVILVVIIESLLANVSAAEQAKS